MLGIRFKNCVGYCCISFWILMNLGYFYFRILWDTFGSFLLLDTMHFGILLVTFGYACLKWSFTASGVCCKVAVFQSEVKILIYVPPKERPCTRFRFKVAGLMPVFDAYSPQEHHLKLHDQDSSVFVF